MADGAFSIDTWPSLGGTTPAAYDAALSAVGPHRAVVLQARAGELARHVRRTGSAHTELEACGRAATTWLQDHFGGLDDALRRAALAAMARGLDWRVARSPEGIRAFYPKAHVRLARVLARPALAPEAFSRGVATASGLMIPVGAINLVAPDAHCPAALPMRLRRAAGASLRQALQLGPAKARTWLEDWRRPWATMHLNMAGLDEFNPAGADRAFRAIAALMGARPELAGICGASWLYDPQLAEVSPELGYIRRLVEAGGARLVRLRADPVTRGYATARSPARCRAVAEGRYRPTAYGLFWRAPDLMAWASLSAAP